MHAYEHTHTHMHSLSLSLCSVLFIQIRLFEPHSVSVFWDSAVASVNVSGNDVRPAGWLVMHLERAAGNWGSIILTLFTEIYKCIHERVKNKEQESKRERLSESENLRTANADTSFLVNHFHTCLWNGKDEGSSNIMNNNLEMKEVHPSLSPFHLGLSTDQGSGDRVDASCFPPKWLGSKQVTQGECDRQPRGERTYGERHIITPLADEDGGWKCFLSHLFSKETFSSSDDARLITL